MKIALRFLTEEAFLSRKKKLRTTGINSSFAAKQISDEAGVTKCWERSTSSKEFSEHLKRRKLQQKPCLKQEHEPYRSKFAEKHVYMNKRRVIFTDEKRFNLEGLDGLHCYYRDLRKGQQLPSRRRYERRQCNDLKRH